MTDPAGSVAALVRHFESIRKTHMTGLPIVNPNLAVEAVGVREFGDHQVCILISPWFMNLVLLPGTDAWSGCKQGDICEVALPGQKLDFTICHDDGAGTFLTAVMFRSVSDFPDQDMARDVAMDVMRQLFTSNAAREPEAPARPRSVLSRRALFTRLGAD